MVEKLLSLLVVMAVIAGAATLALSPQHPREILPRIGDGVNREVEMHPDVTL